MRVFNALRNAGVSLSAINQAQRWLQNETGIERPFATEFLWTGQGEIFAEWSEDMVSIGRFGQIAFDFLQDYLTKVDDLGFNESTGMAINGNRSMVLCLNLRSSLELPASKVPASPLGHCQAWWKLGTR